MIYQLSLRKQTTSDVITRVEGVCMISSIINIILFVKLLTLSINSIILIYRVKKLPNG